MKASVTAALVVLSMTGAAPVQADPVLRIDRLYNELNQIEKRLNQVERRDGVPGLRQDHGRREVQALRVDRRNRLDDDDFDWRHDADGRRYGREAGTLQQRKWLERDNDD